MNKTAEEMSVILSDFATVLKDHESDHPMLEPLVRQISAKSKALVRPPAGQVELSYVNDEIIIKNVPYLHRRKFSAWGYKLAELKGVVTGHNADGEEIYASSYDKDRETNVLPISAKEGLKALCAEFFENTPIVEG